jgi:hypothetical protein
MSESLETQVRGEWWRHREYVFGRGGVIRPVPGALPHAYDPWAGYELRPLLPRPKGKKLSLPRPYLSLATLVSELQFADDAEGYFGALSAEGREQVLQWHRDNGPLGVLPHRLLEAAIRSDAPVSAEDPPDTVFVRTTSRGWIRKPVRPRPLPRRRRAQTDASEAGSERPLRVARPEYECPSRPYAVVIDWDESRRQEDLDQACARFLADGTLELPLSGGFQCGYVEPWQDFYEAASMFAELVLSYAEPRPPARSSDERAAEKRDAERRLARLNALTASVSLVAEPDGEGGFHYRWRSPSLLASLTQMLKQDIVGKRLVRCIACSALFVTPRKEATYCSESCALRFQKRRQRQRAKNAEPSKAETKTDPL